MQKVKMFLGAAMVATFWGAQGGEALKLASPAGTCALTFELTDDGAPTYALTCAGKAAVLPSRLGFTLKNRPALTNGFIVAKSTRAAHDETWRPVWGEEEQIRDRHNELHVDLVQKKTGRHLGIRFRLFEDGLGFRYEFAPTGYGVFPEIWTFTDECTRFALPGDPVAWWIPADFESQEYDYHETRVSAIEQTQRGEKISGSGWAARGPASAVQTALMIKYDNGLYVNLHEAACLDFATLYLDWKASENAFAALLTPSPDGTRGRMKGPFNTPWRTVICSTRAEDILASRITLNLNAPCALADTSWIKPVKYIGVWWEMMACGQSWSPIPGHPEMHAARTENVKRYIDFAAKHGIDALLIEGWNRPYGVWVAEKGVKTADFCTTYDDVDMDAIAAYARAKNVKLCLHSETSANWKDFERIIDSHYETMNRLNASSVKCGYVSEIDPDGLMHYSQTMNNHYNFCVRKAAEHRICVNQHEAVRPTGLCRTWPNLLANESARGQEFDSFGHVNTFHTTVIPFTRLIGGPMDYTPGIVEPNLKKKHPGHRKTFMSSTVCRQLALYVTMPSPLQMAADLPEHYEANLDLFEFIKEVPVDWSESRYLAAEPGRHILAARRGKGTDAWYVGCTAGDAGYDADFTLDFLPAGKTYRARIWKDGANAAWDKNPTAHAIETREVTAASRLTLHAASGGGFAISLHPVR